MTGPFKSEEASRCHPGPLHRSDGQETEGEILYLKEEAPRTIQKLVGIKSRLVPFIITNDTAQLHVQFIYLQLSICCQHQGKLQPHVEPSVGPSVQVYGGGGDGGLGGIHVQ